MTTGTFTPELTPAARPGDTIRLDDGDSIETFRVVRFAPRPAVAADTISPDGNSTETDVELTDLEVWDGWLAQYRLLDLGNLPADVSIELDLGGRQAPMWTSQNDRGSIDRDTGRVSSWDSGATSVVVEDQYTNLTEFFVHGQEVPYATVTNDQGDATDVDLVFSGFVYQLERAGATDDPAAQVPVASIRGS